MQVNHLEYIKGIYALYNARNTNGFDFDFVNTLSKIKLKTVDNEFRSAFNIHVSNIYKPNLDLETDNDIVQVVHFLSKQYYDNKVSTRFLTKMGVYDNFKFLPVVDRIQIDKFIDKNYLHKLVKICNYLKTTL